MNKRIKKKRFTFDAVTKWIRTEIILDHMFCFYDKNKSNNFAKIYTPWRFYLRQYNFNKRHTTISSYRKKRQSYYNSNWEWNR